ncbi:MAG: secretin N-terminal domain-containing protein [Candidatus Omnitrophota bacterium]|nr:hypothetical protein [Candidatus Omnitrophota bacterium]
MIRRVIFLLFFAGCLIVSSLHFIYAQEEVISEVAWDTVAADETAADTQVAAIITQNTDIESEGDADSDGGDVDVNGEEISLDLKGVDITDLFRVLSIKTGKTIVPSKNIGGRINIFLNKVTFEDAIDVILVSQGLAVEKKEKILFVMTDKEYKAHYGRDYVEKRVFKSLSLKYANPENIFSALGSIKSDIGKIIVDKAAGVIILLDTPENIVLMEKTVKELDKPLQIAVFDLNYAKTEEIKSSLTDIVTADTGEVVVDERSSKVFVLDLPQKLEEMEKMIAAFDEESRQVFIEAEILEITLDDRFRRGIEWEKLFNRCNFHGLDLSGDFGASSSLSSYQQISVGTVSSDGYNAVVQYLQEYTDVKILSRPRICVVNNEEAKILVGSREAYVSQTQSQGTTTVTAEAVEFIDVGVKLNVVPTINKDGFITMKIKPEISSVRATLTTSLDSEIPIVDTAEAETVVKVKDGSTIMLAGLIKEEDRDTIEGNPLLSKIPLISGLFSNRDRRLKKTETVIFITPKLTSGEEFVKGSEIEKFIPEDIMPEDMKEKIVLDEIEKIEVEKVEHPVEKLVLRKTDAERKQKESDIQRKMKGSKDIP